MEREEQKRQQLLSAALEVFVAKGYRGASTAEISQRAGAATGSLFYHFKSKEKLYETLYLTSRRQLLDALFDEVSQVAALRAKLERLWQGAVGWCLSHPQHYSFLKSVEVTPSFATWRSEQVECNAVVFRRLLDDTVQVPLTTEQWQLLCELFVGMHEGGVRFFLKNPSLIEQPQWWQNSFEMCWQALRPTLTAGDA